MCLGIPGKIIKIFDSSGTKMATVDFGGVTQDVCIETVPEAQLENYVIVHAGFALSLLSEEDAQETLTMLEEISRLSAMDNS